MYPLQSHQTSAMWEFAKIVSSVQENKYRCFTINTYILCPPHTKIQHLCVGVLQNSSRNNRNVLKMNHMVKFKCLTNPLLVTSTNVRLIFLKSLKKSFHVLHIIQFSIVFSSSAKSFNQPPRCTNQVSDQIQSQNRWINTLNLIIYYCTKVDHSPEWNFT